MCPYPQDLQSSSSNEAANRRQTSAKTKPNYHDVRELTTLRKFDAQSADDISVEGGEQVFADLANQIEKDWLWVYAPSTGKYGYIPKDNVSLTSQPQRHSVSDSSNKNIHRPP